MHERHGMTGTPERNSWDGAKKRCHSITSKDYPRYGAKGIRMCDAWRNSFTVFYTDMGPKPGREYSLERVDGTRGYEPDNCVWALPVEQTLNRKITVWVDFSCKRLSLKDACAAAEVPYHTIHNRMRRHSMTFYQAIAFHSTGKGGGTSW